MSVFTRRSEDGFKNPSELRSLIIIIIIAVTVAAAVDVMVSL